MVLWGRSSFLTSQIGRFCDTIRSHMGNQHSNNCLPAQQETADSNNRNSLIVREFDVGKELEHDEMPPEKRQRVDEQSMVIYGQEQGSSSNSYLTCHLDWLSNNSALYPKIVILKERLDILFARRCDVLAELGHAEIQPGKKRREEVHHWLTEVQKKEDKIRSMIKDGQGTSSNSKLSVSIETFIEEVDELIQRGKFPHGLVLLDHRSTRYPLSQDLKAVGSNFQQNTEKILRWLRNHEHCIIGVYGMGGVGKTTLLAHIHDQLLLDSNLFGDVCWVTVSQNCSVRKLQEDIARAALGSDLQEHDEKKRAGLLHSRLAARGPTILFLDDMWEPVSITDVGIPLGKSNCKIILSSRSSDVCRKMGCKDCAIKAEILHGAEAWGLFVEKLGRSVYDTLEEEAKKLARNVAIECGGLPLAIALIARSMTGVVDIYEWKTALIGLKSARDQGDEEKELFRKLRYSYDRLNDERLQECFLSCIFYGEDVKIRRTTLIDLWINMGLLDDFESRDYQVAKGRGILNKQVQCCLLESVIYDYYPSDLAVKTHDVIRDMGILITREDPRYIAEAGKQLEQVPEKKWNKDLVKVSLSHNRIEEIPNYMTPITPNLTLLMLNNNPLKEIPNSFFVHMKALRVLDLSWTKIQRVPENVSDMENLRALLLGHCWELIYVPSVAKLTKLRTLDLECCDKLEEAPRGLERLKSVEKLIDIPWDVSDVIGFNEVIESLTSLSHYRFVIHDSFDSLSTDGAQIYETYGRVVWIGRGKFREGESCYLLPTTLECLIIENCDMKKGRCDMEGRCLGDAFPSLGEVKGIKSIFINHSAGFESISGSSGTRQGSSVCTAQLEELILIDLPDFRSISRLGVPHSFSQLKELIIIGCPKLKVVIPMMCTSDLQLPHLDHIEVANCEVEEIFESNKASNPTLSLPNFRELELRNLPELRSIYRGRLHCTSLWYDIPGLKFECPKLKLWRFPEGDLTSNEACSLMEPPPETLLEGDDEVCSMMEPPRLPEGIMTSDEAFSTMEPPQVTRLLPEIDLNYPTFLPPIDDDITSWGFSLSL